MILCDVTHGAEKETVGDRMITVEEEEVEEEDLTVYSMSKR